MSEKQFKQECERLEKAGWTLVEYEQENKYAKYKMIAHVNETQKIEAIKTIGEKNENR